MHDFVKSAQLLSLEHKTAKNLTKLYITALTAVAFLTLFGQMLIQRSISNQLADSHIINMAGKQRYMSQQISKVVLLIYYNTSHIHYKNKSNDLKLMLSKWEKNHQALKNGEDGNSGNQNSKIVQQMFARLEPVFQQIYVNSNAIVNKSTDFNENAVSIAPEVERILACERIFLVLMDKIVEQYDIEAKNKVIFLQQIELLLLVLTLLILLLEGIFIFRPAAATIRNTIQNLMITENKASSLANDLLQSNSFLEKSLKELEDVNYALNSATIVAKTDKYGTISFVNEKFCTISGFSNEELIGSKFGMISGHYHSKKFFDEMWNTISNGGIWNNEIKNKAKDGTAFWLDATIVPVMGFDAEPSQYIAIYTDVTLRFRQSINEQKIRSASLMEGQEKERRKIARELHDGLGQMLTALKFNIEAIKGAPNKQEKLNLDEIKNFLLDTIKEVRRISFNLMPSVLNDFGIVSAFKHLTDQVSKHGKITVKFENQSQLQRLPKPVEINLYRILQEALNNIVKYAQANEVEILLENSESMLKLQIKDNGIGFNSKSLDKKNLINSGNGIANIQERTSLINGEFKMETAPGQGTKILIEVPLTLNS